MTATQIEVAQGYVALIDAADRDVLDKYVWYPLKGPRGIVYAYDPARETLMHRLVLGLTGNRPFVDHRNHDGLDNQRANLRPCTSSQNGGNMRRPVTNSSGYKGVSWHKMRGRWAAWITVDGRSRYLGLFSDAWEAAQAYNAAAIDAWGEFALVNSREPFADQAVAGTPLLDVEHRPNPRASRNNRSGYRGVNWKVSRRRWVAQITNGTGKQRHLGYFDDPWLAALAYNAAAIELWGPTARLNERGVS